MFAVSSQAAPIPLKWLVVKEDGGMEQIVKQVRKLHDVLDVQVGHAEPTVFNRLAGCLEC